jgi:hypothetical protein
MADRCARGRQREISGLESPLGGSDASLVREIDEERERLHTYEKAVTRERLGR